MLKLNFGKQLQHLAKTIAYVQAQFGKKTHLKNNSKLGKLLHILKLHLAKKHARVQASVGKQLHILKLYLANKCTF